ncbi:hypothetical protein LDC_0341, partial [sediment metagenome]
PYHNGKSTRPEQNLESRLDLEMVISMSFCCLARDVPTTTGASVVQLNLVANHLWRQSAWQDYQTLLVC